MAVSRPRVNLADGTTNVYRANRPTTTPYTQLRQSAVNALGSQGRSTLTPSVNQWIAGQFQTQNRAGAGSPTQNRFTPRNTGGGGGGGGGGAPADPTMTQGLLDSLAALLAGGGPQGYQVQNLDLPDFQGTFDPSMYNELEGRLGTAVGQSRAAADEAYNNLGNYLTTNYRNAFAGGAPQAQAPGMNQQAMSQALQRQGVNPAILAAEQQGAAAANAGFGNIWSLLGANEDIAQRNRLNRVQTDRGTTNRALDAAMLQGQTGIGMQRAQAQAAFNQAMQERNWQTAQQEAMANWQTQQQANIAQSQNTNEYRNAALQALMGLVPEMVRGGLNMPAPQALGW